jgi:hypothetical protein
VRILFTALLIIAGPPALSHVADATGASATEQAAGLKDLAIARASQHLGTFGDEACLTSHGLHCCGISCHACVAGRVAGVTGLGKQEGQKPPEPIAIAGAFSGRIDRPPIDHVF